MNLEKLKNGFNQYFVNVLKTQYTDFNGRATRSQYWFFMLNYFIVLIPISLADTILNTQALGLIIGLAMIVPSIAIGIRRLHDLNLSGWFYLLVLVPFVGAISLLVLFCLPTDQFNNKNKEKASDKKAA